MGKHSPTLHSHLQLFCDAGTCCPRQSQFTLGGGVVVTGGGGEVVTGAELDASLQTPAEVHVLYGSVITNGSFRQI